MKLSMGALPILLRIVQHDRSQRQTMQDPFLPPLPFSKAGDVSVKALRAGGLTIRPLAMVVDDCLQPAGALLGCAADGCCDGVVVQLDHRGIHRCNDLRDRPDVCSGFRL
jgi:hypothetical protein